jgi:hypothetical protein
VRLVDAARVVETATERIQTPPAPESFMVEVEVPERLALVAPMW